MAVEEGKWIMKGLERSMFHQISGGQESGMRIRGNGERSLRQVMRWLMESFLIKRLDLSAWSGCHIL